MWKKTVIHILKLTVGQYLFLFDIHCYIKKKFGLTKKARMLKVWELYFIKEEPIQNVQSKRTLRFSNSLPLSSPKHYYWNVFLPISNNFSKQNSHDKPVSIIVSRLNLGSVGSYQLDHKKYLVEFVAQNKPPVYIGFWSHLLVVVPIIY